MKVENKTRKVVLSDDAGLAGSFFSRMRGLMFSRNKDLVIKAACEGVMESSIHMMFMNGKIDVVWVDSNMRVVDARKDVPPLSVRKPSTWKVYSPKSPALYVIELAKGSSKNTREGDRISLT